MHPAAVELAIRLNRATFSDRSKACELAAILAHVRTSSNERSIAARLGAGESDSRLMSSVRFRRLMQADSGAERMRAFRRAIKILDSKANVELLAYAWLFWDASDRGERIRTDWMFDYVGSASTASDPMENNDESIKEIEE